MEAALNESSGQVLAPVETFQPVLFERTSNGGLGADPALGKTQVLPHEKSRQQLTAASPRMPKPTPSKGSTTPCSGRADLAFSRCLTSEMSLRLMNIPRAMHQGLGLSSAYPLEGRRRCKRCTIYVCSPDGGRHPVAIVCASGSYHRRLTEGWGAVCRLTGLSVGDTVHFRRTDRPDVLDMTITWGVRVRPSIRLHSQARLPTRTRR